ncbi:MAG: hypothetical protein HW400_244 [Candidatus Levybacteria bacterium]|nr:hypothetical protein [Candidatus Levybacteria bacterium]
MTMEALDRAGRHPENQDPTKQFAIEQAKSLLIAAGVKDPGMSVVAKVETGPVLQAPDAPVDIKRFSKDQLVLPETAIPQEVSAILQRAEKAGIGVFEPYRLSGVTLNKDSKVDGWNKKPESWYWKQIENGEVSQDTSKLPDTWVLIDKTVRPDYQNGKQLHENDSFGPLLKRLRKEKKIQTVKGIPDTSRFGISPDELTQVVLPEIAKILGVDASAVRLPKEIEFNIIGNFEHPEWGKANTWEWFADKFGDDDRLVGGLSGYGGLARVRHFWSGDRGDFIAFRPLVVVSPKA